MVSRYTKYYARLDAVATSRLTYDDGALRIDGLDRTGSVVVELRFQDVLLTRITDEGVRLQLLQDLEDIHCLALLDEQSELIRWLLQESLHTRDLRCAKHYILLIGEEVFDVVTLSEPEISETRI